MLRILAGHGILISYNLVREGKITLVHLRALAAAGCEVMFDNGEFTRWKTGKATDADGFYAFLRLLDAEGIPWVRAIAVDVIGDAEGTRRLWRQAKIDYPDLIDRLMPVFHEGDPWDLLDEYRPHERPVALGRVEGRGSKHKTFVWYDAVFNRYPDGIFHALGNANPETLEAYPFHWFDASTWEMGAAFSHAHGWPFNRCSKEIRMEAYISASETIYYKPPKQLALIERPLAPILTETA